MKKGEELLPERAVRSEAATIPHTQSNEEAHKQDESISLSIKNFFNIRAKAHTYREAQRTDKFLYNIYQDLPAERYLIERVWYELLSLINPILIIRSSNF